MPSKKSKKEIEIKAKISSSQKEEVRRRIIRLGGVLKDKTREADIYFTSPCRDFIKTKECLRIRKRGDYKELTYKGPSSVFMEKKKQFWKSEINIPLFCSVKEASNLLQCLGFRKVAKVLKERETFRLGKNIITFDKIEKLGWFLEIEQNVHAGKEKEATKENLKILAKIGIEKSDIVSEPYRDLVIKKST